MRQSILPLNEELGIPPPYIMGILNVTPDSFSDGGKFFEPGEALTHADNLLRSGASIIDVGGESTGPGAEPMFAEAELSRIAPVVQTLAPKCFLSVDTYHATTAEFALRHGARMINDVSALRASPEMGRIIAAHRAFVVLMYSKEAARTPYATNTERDYEDVIDTICEFFRERIDYALEQGILESQIILDPGMGKFVSHDPKYSWEILRRFCEFRARGFHFPLMVSTSRKSFLPGKLINRDPATQFTSLFAVTQGAQLIRTHNVEMAQEFLQLGSVLGMI